MSPVKVQILEIAAKEGRAQRHDIQPGQVLRLKAAPQVRYQLEDVQTRQLPKGLKVRRREQDLWLALDDSEVVLASYYDLPDLAASPVGGLTPDQGFQAVTELMGAEPSTGLLVTQVGSAVGMPALQSVAALLGGVAAAGAAGAAGDSASGDLSAAQQLKAIADAAQANTASSVNVNLQVLQRAGVTGATDASLAWLRDVLNSAQVTAESVATLAQLQALVDAIKTVQAYSAAAGQTVPTVVQLQAALAGATDAAGLPLRVDDDNLAATLQQLAQTNGQAPISSLAAYSQCVSVALAAYQAALETLGHAAQANNALTTSVAVTVYQAAGVQGVTDGNLRAINRVLDSAAVDRDQVSTAAKVQALVDSYNTELADALQGVQSYTGASGQRAPTAAQLNRVLGSEPTIDTQAEVNADNLAVVQAALAAANATASTRPVAWAQVVLDALASYQAALDALGNAAQANDVAASPVAALVYQAAGVRGVNERNVLAIDSVLDSAAVGREQVNTAAKVQALVDSYNKVLAAADGTDGNAPALPSPADYAALGLTLNTANAALLSDVIDGKALADVSTVGQLQALAEAVRAVQAYTGSLSSAVSPGVAQFNALVGELRDSLNQPLVVTADNVAAVRQALAALNVQTGLHTQAELAELVATVSKIMEDKRLALDAIVSAAQANTASSLTAAQYSTAGIQGVTADNLAAINSVLNTAAVTGPSVSTVPQLQALVDSYNKVLAVADGVDGNAATLTLPVQADYNVLGMAVGSAVQVNLLNDVVEGQAVSGVNTAPRLLAILDAVKAVQAYTGESGQMVPTAAQLNLVAWGTQDAQGQPLAVNAGNVHAVLGVLVTANRTGTVSTQAALRSLVANAMQSNDGPDPSQQALALIQAAAQNNTASTLGTQDYVTAGVSGVSAGHLPMLASVLDSTAVSGAMVASRDQLQALVNAVDAVLRNAGDANAPVPDTALAALGVQGVRADNLAAVQAALAASPSDGSAVSTLAHLQALVDAINDAPVLQTGQLLTLGEVAEDSVTVPTAGTPGVSVNLLVEGVSDVDTDAHQGVAIVDVNGGTLYVSEDDGQSWVAVSNASDSHALLLKADGHTQVVFRPDANYNGTLADAITFRAWDQSAGTAGTYADASVNGGVSAFSADTDTVAITVTPVNDAPVLSGTLYTDSDPDVAAYLEGDLASDPLLPGDWAITDGDDTFLTQATLRITDKLADGSDVLNFEDTASVHGHFDAATGVLTLTAAQGRASVADFKAAIEAVRYESLSFNPTDVWIYGDTPHKTRTLRLTVSDDGAGTGQVQTSAPMDLTLVVSALDNAPVVTLNTNAQVVTGGLAGVGQVAASALTQVDPSLSLTDADDTQLFGAFVRVANWNYAQDVLALDLQDGGGQIVSTVLDVRDADNQAAALAAVDAALNGKLSHGGTVVTGVTYVAQGAANPSDFASVQSGLIDANDQATAGFLQITWGYQLTVDPNDAAFKTPVLHSLGDYEAVLRSLRVGSNEGNSERPVEFTVSDASKASVGFTRVASETTLAEVVSQYTGSGSASSRDVQIAFATNTAPVVSLNASSLSWTEAGSALVLHKLSGISDPDASNNPDHIRHATVVLSNALASDELISPSAGQNGQHVRVDGPAVYDASAHTWTLSFSGRDTQANYLALINQLVFRNTSDDPTAGGTRNSRTVSVTVADDFANGTAQSGLSGIAQFTVGVTAVNDAPLLADTVLALGTVLQNAVAPSGAAGTLVSALVGGMSDPEGAAVGVAITGSSANGVLYVSSDNGQSWTALSGLSNSHAWLLSAQSGRRVYFKPNAGFSGAVNDALTLRAWDGTVGAEGSFASANTNGGSSAFSGNTDTASVWVQDKSVYLGNLGGTQGFVINGLCANDATGWSVARAGDVNGDGLADVLVGATNADPANVANAGRSYVVFGTTAGGDVQLSSLVAGVGGFVINGYGAGSNAGQSVSAAGDVNGDGLADLLVGAHKTSVSNNVENGRTYVVYGQTDTTAVELSTVATGGGGFVIDGQCAGDQSGYSVSSAGDVNGDGLPDLIVGATFSDPANLTSAGRSYVVFGRTNNTPISLSAVANGVGGFVLNGQSSIDQSGNSVSAVGDLNGDGLSDLLVGAIYADPGGVSNAGRAYVVFGKTSTTAVELSAVGASVGGFVVQGKWNSDTLGGSVSAAGDVNGDGVPDVLIGGRSSGGGGLLLAGRSYVVFGKSSNTTVNVSALEAGIGGFVINGQAATDYSGGSVSAAGDVNGDGLADVIVGAYYADPAGTTNAGRSYVVFGKTGTTTVNLSAVATGAGGFVIHGQCTNDYSGFSVSGAGDVNGDGYADLLVGAYNAGSTGKTYVIYGGSQYASGTVALATGTSADEWVVGTAGADTLVGGGGVDRLSAGAGNDTLVVQASDVTHLLNHSPAAVKALVDGGLGHDTLQLAQGAGALDLTALGAGRLSSIERMDLASDTTANTLTLSATQLNALAGVNLIHTGLVSADGHTWMAVNGSTALAATAYHQLVVDGAAGDVVQLSGSVGAWFANGQVNNGLSNYTVFQNNSTHSQLLVQAGVTVHYAGQSVVAPVVLDVNRDGIFSYTHLLIDVSGDGKLDYTAWAGPQDGVLVWNKFGDGLVHNSSQYAFSRGLGETDLQGLAAGFDSNHDGLLSAQDAKFGEFMVWQDANGDGVSQASEMRALVDLGVLQLDLDSDGVTRSNGDGVTEAGRSSATTSDGHSMLVSDARFAYQDAALSASTTASGGLKLSLGGLEQTLDLANLQAIHGPVAEVDLTGLGDNTLQLKLSDVLARPVVVDGDAGDALALFTGGEPVLATTTQRDGQTWQAYDFNRDGQLDLLVQQAVVVNVH